MAVPAILRPFSSLLVTCKTSVVEKMDATLVLSQHALREEIESRNSAGLDNSLNLEVELENV